MGDSRISNALRDLAGGLQNIAAFRADQQQKDESRKFQQAMQESSQAFSARMQEISMQHSETMLGKQQDFNAGESDKDRAFRGEMFDKEQGARMKMFGMEQGAINARHAQSLGAQFEQLKQQASQVEDAKKDRDLQRQLKVYELGVSQASGQHSSLLDQMNKEMGEIAKNPMLAVDPKKLAAAKQEVSSRYAPQLQEATGKIEENIKKYAGAVGIPDFSGVTGNKDNPETKASGGMPGMDRDKVSQAVQAAQTQIGGGAMPSEQALVNGFMGKGLTRPEAIAAARQMKGGR